MPEDAKVCRHPQQKSTVTVSDEVLNGMDGSAAVFVPQVNGFSHNGVRVFLGDLRGEKSLEELSLVFSIITINY